ncbi:SDR family NAD(P)-dependent oxidoreductase [Nitrogeniibacter mangrovi]|uniref:SDR family NAD(P)-dependent oxidoreductase n=1 Tax=Nitrogeniibacter mangrovi TaxID=2016596 RepID=A0A6C1B7H8_9RHOO|nr:SDR family NAD(P)-dependent oxidoreductase [Nitrogeniibacter mangrovi]
MNRRLTDWRGRRVWLIGASSGIGEALAQRLAAEGARLALSARRADALERVAEAVGGAQVLPFDVTAPEGFAGAWARLIEAWGGCDLVVFLAGAYRPTRAWELDEAAIRPVVETNLLATLRGVATVLPTFLSQGQGAIALVASVAGYGGLPRACVYGPTKAALINFAESLFIDLRPRGVDVFLINPGFVDTPLTAANTFPMPALMHPDEAAEAIVRGLAAGRFEIHFPTRFSRVLKALNCLPYRLYFGVVRRVTGL